MHQTDCDFMIKACNVEKAHQAILDLQHAVGQKEFGHYDWVDLDKVNEALDFKEAIEEWRWVVEMEAQDTKQIDPKDLTAEHFDPQPKDTRQNVIGIEFNGDKLGDDMLLLDAIAPYVEEGSWVAMDGQEGCWVWDFHDGIVKEIDN